MKHNNFSTVFTVILFTLLLNNTGYSTEPTETTQSSDVAQTAETTQTEQPVVCAISSTNGI